MSEPPIIHSSRVVSSRMRECELGEIHLSAYHTGTGGIPLDRMRILGNYAVVYNIGGEADYVDELGPPRKLLPGDLLIVFPDIAHAYGATPGHTWSEFFIEFNGSIFGLWRKEGLLNPERPIIRLQPVDYWLQRLEALGSEGAQPWQDRTLWQLCGIQQLLAEVLEIDRKGDTDRGANEWLALACSELEKNLEHGAGDAHLHAAARRLTMSYETFRKRFAQLSGVPPARYRMQRVMRRACDLLQQPGATNKEVAAACGFCDEFHFAKRFRKVVGTWPRDFRRQLQRETRGHA